jgi:hypothetical protein
VSVAGAPPEKDSIENIIRRIEYSSEVDGLSITTGITIMKLTRIFIVAGAFAAPAAHAQINQILGVIHSAQSAITQTAQVQPQQDTAQLQAQQAQQQRIDYQTQHPVCNANCPLDPADKAKYEAQQQRDQNEAQQQTDAARKIAGMCPD